MGMNIDQALVIHSSNLKRFREVRMRHTKKMKNRDNS